jgi:chemotaxis protein MotB
MRTAGRRRPTGEAGSDSYLASVSDLMSGLIFIFVITLAVFALRLALQTEKQRAEKERHKAATERLESADRTKRHILDDIAVRLEKAGIKVEVLHEQGVLRLSEKGIFFEPGEVRPRKDHAEHVGHLARVLAEVIPCYVAFTAISPVDSERPSYCSTPGESSDDHCERPPSHLETLLIEGHTDTQPVSPGHRFRNNLELSSMRAATVYQMPQQQAFPRSEHEWVWCHATSKTRGTIRRRESANRFTLSHGAANSF